MDRLRADYRFFTTWRLDVPPDPVWRALAEPHEWPRWWPGCVVVETLDGGPTQRVGSCYRFHWQGPLPYCLIIRIRLTALEDNCRMLGEVDGPLLGTAEWRLRAHAGHTEVDFEFAVSGAQAWTRYLAPFARPLFRWNHRRLMAAGERGLQRWLRQPDHSGSRGLRTDAG